MCYSALLSMQVKQTCTNSFYLELSASCILVKMKAAYVNNFNKYTKYKKNVIDTFRDIVF